MCASSVDWMPIAPSMIPASMILVGLGGAIVALWRQHRANRLLQQSEERYALAARASNEGIWDWNLQTQEIYFSAQWQMMLGFEENALSNSPDEWLSRVHRDDIEPLKMAIATHLNEASPCFEHQHRIRHRDGTYRWVINRGLAIRDQGGDPRRIVGSQCDVTDRKKAEEQRLIDAYYDRLTGLPNRALFLDRLRQALACLGDAHIGHQSLSSSAFAVLMLDLDRFKVVNNSLGSDVGDQLLMAVAQRVNACLRTGEVLARVGGDEFAILLSHIHSIGDTTRIAEQIQGLLALPFHLDGQEIFTTASIGIALSSARYEHPEHLLRDADTATFRAKAQGGSRYQIFERTMHIRMITNLQLEGDLRRAIATISTPSDRPEFRLYYQPVVHLATGNVSGFEALIRWQHPEQGLISPTKFIPIAEKNGLIVTLGWWVLREACRQMHRWSKQVPNTTPLTLSVNLASKQFSCPDLIEHVRYILEDTHVDPSYLKLEITESAIMENARLTIETLHHLKSLGIQLAIDDFGTGYSSLSYLRRFPIDTLKIDRSFIKRLNTDRESSEIVRTVVSLAHNLKMDVTAEGIETRDHLAQLLSMRCENGQGYFFSAPLTADEASDLMLREQHKNYPPAS
ncbi:MAG: putative bifunctional diguanylate cyclase/phosphodiesterase [Elainellaceae cyanobacterium]